MRVCVRERKRERGRIVEREKGVRLLRTLEVEGDSVLSVVLLEHNTTETTEPYKNMPYVCCSNIIYMLSIASI